MLSLASEDWLPEKRGIVLFALAITQPPVRLQMLELQTDELGSQRGSRRSSFCAGVAQSLECTMSESWVDLFGSFQNSREIHKLC